MCSITTSPTAFPSLSSTPRPASATQAAVSNLVFMASYQAAVSYIKFREKTRDDVILVDPTLRLFGEYFATYARAHVLCNAPNHRATLELLAALEPQSLTYWGYTLSQLGLVTARYAKARGISTHFILPSEF